MADDDEEYEPDFEPMETADQVKNRLEMESEDLGIGIPKLSQLKIGPFYLPEPPPLQRGDLQVLAMSTMNQMFRRIDVAPTEPHAPPQLFAAEHSHTPATDRNSLAKAFVRLLTRPSAGTITEPQAVNGGGARAADGVPSPVKRLADRGRVQLLQYILNDWTRRMDVATTWLTEEWYGDRVAARAHAEAGGGGAPPPQNYPRWVNRFLDELSAFVGGEHAKLLIRFASEIPAIDADVVARIMRLALDPERVGLVVSVLHYLALFRDPVRELCLDAVEDLWRNSKLSSFWGARLTVTDDGAKAATAPILKRFKREAVLTAAVEATG
jgi:symplekin